MIYINVSNVSHSFSRYGIKAITYRKFRGPFWAMVAFLNSEKGKLY